MKLGSELSKSRQQVLGRQHRSSRKSDQEWQRLRATIEELYIKQSMTLKHVMSIMTEQYGFTASRRQYEYHFALWKACKYNPRQQALETPTQKSHGNIPILNFTSPILESLYDDDTLASVTASMQYSERDLFAGEDFQTQTDGALVESSNFDWLTTPAITESLLPSTSTPASEHGIAMARSSSSFTDSTATVDSNDTLAPFIAGDFIDIDIEAATIPITTRPDVHVDHHWQVPKYLSRLWELDTPTSERSAEQQYRVQKLIWCLWMCGNGVCFTNLARGHERIVRVEDDITRFEAKIEDWIESSIGCSRPSKMQHSFSGDRESSTDNTVLVTAPQDVLEAVQCWTTHARFGQEFAVLNATRRRGQAKKLLSRLMLDLTPTAGSSIFFLSVARVMAICQRYLSADIVNIRSLDADVRSYISQLFRIDKNYANESTLPSAERRAVGILSALCYHRWSQDAYCQAYFEHTEALTIQHTGFPIQKIFQWTIRLLLFHSVQFRKSDDMESTELSPIALCSMALNGLSALNLGSILPKAPVFGHHTDFQEIKQKLSTIWINWLSRDAAWFLTTTALSDCSDLSANLWLTPHTSTATV